MDEYGNLFSKLKMSQTFYNCSFKRILGLSDPKIASDMRCIFFYQKQGFGLNKSKYGNSILDISGVLKELLDFSFSFFTYNQLIDTLFGFIRGNSDSNISQNE